MKYKIKKLEETCRFCPTQWEGKLEDERMIYIRYRHGCLDVTISENPTNDISDAVEGKSIFQRDVGGAYGGVMDNEQMLSILKNVIECDVGIIS